MWQAFYQLSQLPSPLSASYSSLVFTQTDLSASNSYPSPRAQVRIRNLKLKPALSPPFPQAVVTPAFAAMTISGCMLTTKHSNHFLISVDLHYVNKFYIIAFNSIINNWVTVAIMTEIC